MNGILLINKPEGFTSFDVIAVMRKLLGMKKIGHMGTLDPMATGVLPILIGNATKLQSIIPESDKEYIAGFKLGVSTDTQDITGKILKGSKVKISQERVWKCLNEFKGEIMQIPPMYSAVKKDGVRLYALARQGIEIKREPRPIKISRLDLLNFNEKNLEGQFIVRCSKGTYIRTLCNDLGEKLGCGCVMTSLKRTLACGFRIKDSITIDTARRLTAEGRIKDKVIPMDVPFYCYRAIHITKKQGIRFTNGGNLMLGRTEISDSECDRSIIRVYDNTENFLGLGIVDREKEELVVFKLLHNKD